MQSEFCWTPDSTPLVRWTYYIYSSASHRVFHVACAWPISQYEGIKWNFVSSKHSTRGWGKASLGGLQPPQAPPPIKPPLSGRALVAQARVQLPATASLFTFLQFHLIIFISLLNFFFLTGWMQLCQPERCREINDSVSVFFTELQAILWQCTAESWSKTLSKGNVILLYLNHVASSMMYVCVHKTT